MNKKGATLSGWAEIAVFSLLFVAIFGGIVVYGLNEMYGKSYDTGLVTNGTQQELIDYQDTLTTEITGGEVNFDSDEGITLKSSWTIIKSGFSMIANFITGSWIENIVSMLKAPPIVATFLRILWFLGLGFIILKILFKVKP